MSLEVKSNARHRKVEVMLQAARRAALMGRKASMGSFPQRQYAVSTQRVPRIGKRQLGQVGLPRTSRSGLILDEPNPSLYPYLARGIADDMGIYEQMWRSDPTIAGMVDLIAREVARAHLSVEGPLEPTKAEGRGLELAVRYLGLDGTEGWLRGGIRQHLRESIRKRMVYGHCPYEVTWSQQGWDSSTVLAPSTLAYRAPNATWGWTWDRDRLRGLIQRVPNSAATLGGFSILLGAPSVTIPVSRLLLYTHNGSQDVNPEGVSMLRPAYTWWRSKRDVLQRYHQAADTLFDGVTTLEEIAHPKTGDAYPSNSKADVDGFEEVMDQFSEGLLAYFFQPIGYKISQSHPEFAIPSPVELLKYFDQQIRMVFVALLLGNPTASSMSNAGAQLLYNSIDSLAQEHIETFNGQCGVETSGVLARLIRANIPEAIDDPSYRYPRLRASGIQFQDTKSWIDSVSKASQFRLLSYTVQTEVQLRAALDLVPLTADQLDDRAEWEESRLEAEITTGDGSVTAEPLEEERASEDGTQAPVVPPDQQPVVDPEGF